MQYYVVSDQGIKFIVLITGRNIAGELTYYINPEATSDEEEYFDSSVVFSDYDDALAYFCNKIAAKIAYHKKAIEALEDAYTNQLRLAGT